MRIPGYGRLAKIISKKIARKNKRQFEHSIHKMLDGCKFDSFESVNIELISFSGYGGFWDQVFCILSFLNNVGSPVKWTIYSDKGHSDFQKRLFKRIPFVYIQDWDVNYEQEFGQEVSNLPWQFKKLIAFSKHSYCLSTIFTDSDILFYPAFRKYLQIITNGSWFLPEPPSVQNLDTNYVNSKATSMYNFNAGFFVLDGRVSFSSGLSYLKNNGDKKPQYFADQTALNLVIRGLDKAQVLDPRIFYLSTDDHFTITHCINYDEIAIRHFVGPVRHKMWQRHWHKVLTRLY